MPSDIDLTVSEFNRVIQANQTDPVAMEVVPTGHDSASESGYDVSSDADWLIVSADNVEDGGTLKLWIDPDQFPPGRGRLKPQSATGTVTLSQTGYNDATITVNAKFVP